MKNMKEDRRARKTKRVLQEGLAELLLEKEIEKITIKELTDKVDIHRGTFYAHYQDIYELNAYMEETTIQEISDILSAKYPSGSTGLRVFYEALFGHILENRKICRLLFRKSANNTFLNRLTNLFIESSLELWSEELKMTVKQEELEYYATFYFSGALSLISQWAKNNFADPIHVLIDLLMGIDEKFSMILKENCNSSTK